MESALCIRSPQACRLACGAIRHGLAILFAAAFLAAGLPGQSVTASITSSPQPTGGRAIFDAAGNVYYTGANGPVTAFALQPQNGGGICLSSGGLMTLFEPCSDAYVAKVDAAGNLVFGTFLGGPGADQGVALATDESGNVFVTGTTGGSFPTTANAAVPSSTTSKAFVAKMSADGSHLLYSTYLPDTTATASAIAIDTQGDAYITGKSLTGHAYVAKLSADGSAFLYNAVLAGSNVDSGAAILVDAAGNVVVTGQTSSTNFPVSPNAVQSRLAGKQNIFVAKLDPDGDVMFSTYLGGSGSDTPAVLQTDSTGNIYVAGETSSLDFPTTPGSFRAAPVVPLWNTSSPAGFIARLSRDGSTLVYSSYVMSREQQSVTALAVTPSGEAYVAGITGAGFPATPSAPQICYQGPVSGFVAHLDAHGALLDATYVGQNADSVGGLSIADDRSISLIWHSSVTTTLSQIRFGEGGWTAPSCLSPSVLNAASLFGGSKVSPGELITLTGFGIGPEAGVGYQPDSLGQVPRQVAGVQVLFDGQAAPVLYAQSRQVNALAPLELSGKTSTMITVTYNGVAIGSITASVGLGELEIFRLQAGSSPQALAMNEDGTLNGPSNPAPRGSFVSLWGTGFGVTDPPCVTGGLNFPGPANLTAGLSVVIFDGQFTPAQYAGSAPTLLCGVEQINMRVPTSVAPGVYQFNVMSVMALDGGQARGNSIVGVTIAVK